LQSKPAFAAGLVASSIATQTPLVHEPAIAAPVCMPILQVSYRSCPINDGPDAIFSCIR
jgi:hypothetical protein